MKASFVFLLSLSFVGLSFQDVFVNDWKPIDDPEISLKSYYIDLANVTVAWYNQQHSTSVVLVNVTGGYIKSVVDTAIIELHYVFDMDVTLEPQPECHTVSPVHYQGAVVQTLVKMQPPALAFYYLGEPIVEFKHKLMCKDKDTTVCALII